ncbi:cytochrome P450 [Obba rivulosa]|uniref:Cytochrome P450 n=1 Tax=Obba rivulosa TaxID=1052685 RepID=A0A8E2ATJ6_9APHY|nr:cytochrome P450 [Obba rivulosa]
MILVSSVLWSLVYAGLAYALFKGVQYVLKPHFSSLRYLPGPPRSDLIYGNLKEIFQEENSVLHEVLHESWVEKYGNTIKYKVFLNMNRLYTVDLKALNHILTHSADYQKPLQSRYFLSRILGKGEDHRKQNPAFGPAQIRELTPIFVDQADKLRDCWDAEISKSGEESTRVNVLDGLTKTTLNIIGWAGFNYDFDALNPEKKNELAEAFNTIFSTTEGGFSLWPLFQYLFPPLRLIQTERGRRFSQAMSVMRRIGMQLVREKKAAVIESAASEKSGVERKDLHGRDLLTLLIRANMATDLPESLRLSDEDVLSRNFLVAGHETTSSATTWCLFALTQAPEVQRKLREELFTLNTAAPTMDELNSLPYLDAVVRETLRVHAPVSSTIREAQKDDIIPLATPFKDTRGQLHDVLKVDKGTSMIIPILAINRSRALWGEDAFEFKPERWESLPEAVASIPGVWGNVMSFLGGPRACIGYRFTLVETKALIFSLVRAFEFELAVPPEDIKKKSQVAQRPIVKSEMETGNQMPLRLKRYQRI